MILQPESAYTHLDYRKGVGIVLFNRQGLVWTGRRIDTPDAWQLPQGGMDEDEDPRMTAFRELQEETGTNKAEIIDEIPGWLTYDLPDALVPTVWGGKFRGQKQKWYAMRYLGEDEDFNLNAFQPAEFDTWKWTELSRIPGMIVPFKRPLYEKIVDYFS